MFPVYASLSKTAAYLLKARLQAELCGAVAPVARLPGSPSQRMRYQLVPKAHPLQGWTDGVSQ